MARIWIGIACWLSGMGCMAQNLVPNGSFEDYTICPDYFSQWDRVVGWTSPYTTSADYFNACAGGDICNVPLNQFGYQFAFDGSAYMGIATCDAGGSPMYREIIAAELTEPLQVGVPVCISFRTTCGGYGSSGANSAAWKGRGPGAQFFVELPNDWESYLYPNIAAVFMDTVLSDTAAWLLVSGTYEPDSAYRYIAIGNFFADSLSWVMPMPDGGGAPVAYSFVDDVRVSADLSYCGSMGILDHGSDPQVLPIANPFGDALVLHANVPLNDDFEVTLWSAHGGLLLSKQWPAGQERLQFSTDHLSAGFCIIQMRGKRGSALNLRLVHLIP
jgi:hypothetical protein